MDIKNYIVQLKEKQKNYLAEITSKMNIDIRIY